MSQEQNARQRARAKYDKENPSISVRLSKDTLERLEIIPGNRIDHIREAVEEWLDKKESSQTKTGTKNPH